MKTKKPLSCIGQRVRQRWRVLLLFFIFALRTVAQNQVRHSNLTDSPFPNSTGLSPVEIDRAIALSGSYLERMCASNGRFAYRIRTSSGQQSLSYNIVRHAGAIYALTMLNHARPDPQARDAMAKAGSFLRENYVRQGVRPDQLVVWSKPQPDGSVADLGATGLGLVALTGVEQVLPASVPIEQLRALGRFLLFLQRPDGSFVSKYRAESGPVEDFESLYYPGEAALGLLDLYEIDPSAAWLNAATKALSYLAESRARLPDVPPDHWALIATAKLLSEYALDVSPALRKELTQHAIQICYALMKDQLHDPSFSSITGAFDPTGRTAPVATRMEGLLAALEFLPPGKEWNQIKETVDNGMTFLLNVQIKSGPYAGGMPEAFLSQRLGASDIRIDYVQHALCAWIRYRSLSQEDMSKPRNIKQ